MSKQPPPQKKKTLTWSTPFFIFFENIFGLNRYKQEQLIFKNMFNAYCMVYKNVSLRWYATPNFYIIYHKDFSFEACYHYQ